MSDEWADKALLDVMFPDVEVVLVDEDASYPIVGVLNRGRGLLHREMLSGRETSYKTLNLIRPRQVVYSRLKAFEGAITVVPSDLQTAYASQEFPTFTCGPDLSPEFFRLVTTTPRLWGELQRVSKGMGGRRERVKPHDFLSLRVSLPPRPVQERIVDVVTAVDDQIAALKAEATEVDRTKSAVLSRLLSNADEFAELRQYGDVIRGRRFTKKDYVEAGLGCIHYGQIYTEFGATASSALTFLPEVLRGTLRFARPNDLVIAGTSENVEDVGKAVAWLGDDEVAVHDDCYIYRHTLNPMFVTYFFASSLFHEQKLMYARGTKVLRISGKDLERISIPVLSPEEQHKIAQVGVALDRNIGALNTEAERLLDVRGRLLAALLNREIEIFDVEGSVA